MDKPIANVQDGITYKFGFTAMELIHPTGVKVTEAKAQVQAQMDRCDAVIAEATAEKARLKKDYLDKMAAAPGDVGGP